LQNKYKDKINELRERNVQQLKKELNDQTEGQLEKTQALLNQRKAEIEKLTIQLDEDTKVEQK